MYPELKMFIAGRWCGSYSDKLLPVVSPATNDVLGQLPCASTADLDDALEAARCSFPRWRETSPFDRARILRRAADLLRERAEMIGAVITLEQGKPLAEGQQEARAAADMFDWFSEESRRIYGRIIPARSPNLVHRVQPEPVGPVAAFTPWNFPLSQPTRKVASALAAGCSIILKGAEETPGAAIMLGQVLQEAGLPDGTFNLVFGDPAEVSSYLVPHPVIRKISFTGSTAVGKHLASLAGLHMKRATMELGGHAPVLIFNDADLEKASAILSKAKYRNAGQVCVSPTRFLVQEDVYSEFVERYVADIGDVKVGNGMDEGVTMGPLANVRRVSAMERLIADAKAEGATIRAGGKRSGNVGNFFEPTVLADVPLSARVMNEEPFGPVALFRPFKDFDSAVAESNRLPFGLAAYVYTGSAETAERAAAAIESGMVSINHQGTGPIETPFGGIKDSGHGSEGGLEAIQAYLTPKFVASIRP